ncbi:hypothetical protein LguiB_002801 [Lonicera macranthoides]
MRFLVGGDGTYDRIRGYSGAGVVMGDPSKPIYMAIKGRIFDVTTKKSFYGPSSAYIMFADKDASRALAKMSKNE